MSAPVIQGWCPGALRPMMSGDGLVVRVRARGGRLEPAQIRAIADLARRHGNGLIDLSARANVQLRGVAEDSHAPLIDGLRSLGVIDASPEAESRRNVVVTPFWDRDDGTADLAARLAAMLAREDAPQTPGKFGYAVDTGAAPVLTGTSADIRIERGAEGGLIVRPDSGDHGAPATPDTAPALALDLARWFLATGGAPTGRGRMAAHLARGAQVPKVYRTASAQTACATPLLPGPCAQGFLAAFAFGQTDADTFAALADLGAVRLTPWRMVLIEGLTTAPDLPGLIADPADPVLNVVACTGAPGCPQSLGPTRALARQLAPQVPPGKLLHVSGCAKGCAHSVAAPATLTATGGDRYDLILNDTAAGPPARPGIQPDDLTTTDLFPTG